MDIINVFSSSRKETLISNETSTNNSIEMLSSSSSDICDCIVYMISLAYFSLTAIYHSIIIQKSKHISWLTYYIVYFSSVGYNDNLSKFVYI